MQLKPVLVKVFNEPTFGFIDFFFFGVFVFISVLDFTIFFLLLAFICSSFSSFCNTNFGY